MWGWLLNLIYAALLLAVSPLVVYRSLRFGRYRRGLREKLCGTLPLRTNFNAPLIWLHAVSVGEVLLLQPLIRSLRQSRPELQVLVSTSTDAGFDVATQKLAGCVVTWCPLDFTWAAARALRRVQPDVLVLAELELWPNLIRSAGDAAVPVAQVNARLSARSAARYRWISGVIRPLLQRLAYIGAQDADTADRLRSLGAAAPRMHVTGSLKFDGLRSDRGDPSVLRLRIELGLTASAPIFVAGSTQAPEEAAALDAWQAARRRHPQLRLVLVPRHRERFDDVAALVQSRGLTLARRSAGPIADASGNAPSTVVLVDTIGELAVVWGLADIAYVGGSLTPGRGGQNLLEPAAYGAAVLCGPHTENFRAIVATLEAAGGLQIVQSASELADQVCRLLDDPLVGGRMGRQAQAVVQRHQGAVERTLAGLLPLLPAAASPERCAA